MRARSRRALWKVLQFTLFTAAGLWAGRFFWTTLVTEGWSPATMFGLFLLIGALSLIAWSSLGLRHAVRRLWG